MDTLQRTAIRRLACPVFALIILVGGTRSASAQGVQSLEVAVDKLAGQISQYLKSRNESSLMMGPFSGPPASGAGTKLIKTLSDELGERKITVSKISGMQVRGNFKQRRQGDRMTVLITANLFDRKGNEIFLFRQTFKKAFEDGVEVSDPEDVANLTGASVDTTTPDTEEETTAEDTPTEDKPAEDTPAEDTPAGDTPPAVDGAGQQVITATEREKEIADAIDNPKVIVTGAVAAAKKGSPFRVELLVKKGDGYIPRPLEVDSGFAFANINVAEMYAVKIYNDSDFDCGVKLTIDGLNSFEFSNNPFYKKLGMWVIPRKSAGLIKGWHRTDAFSDSFLIADLPDTAAAKLGRETSAIGTITASFFAAWSPGENPPKVETLANRSKGTARGPEVQQRNIPVLRFFGRSLLAAVSIRYVKPDPPEDLPPTE